MRVFLWLSLALVTGCVLAIAGAVLLAVQEQPLVDRAATFTPENIERAKGIFERNDPRKLRSGEIRSATIPQREADLALNYLLQRHGRGSSQVVLQQGAAHLLLTLKLPRNPLGGYLNVDATLTQGPGLPRIDALRIGRLPIPFGLGDWLLDKTLAILMRNEDARLIASMVKRVTFGNGHFTVVYQWQAGLPARLQAAAIPPEEQERLRQHQARLAETTRRIAASGGGVPLVDLMRPQFQFAAERSVGGDAVAENRAAILVLTLHATGQELAALVPNANRWPRPVPLNVQLSGRDDFALHFLVSAAIASNAGTSLANAVGLYKEIADSRGGSGFSFNDLAADGAGTRFGDLAVASPAAARKLQQHIADGIRESDIMPATEDLPEFMPEAEFLRRFGGVGAPAYLKMTTEIERRIAALPMHR